MPGQQSELGGRMSSPGGVVCSSTQNNNDNLSNITDHNWRPISPAGNLLKVAARSQQPTNCAIYSYATSSLGINQQQRQLQHRPPITSTVEAGEARKLLEASQAEDEFNNNSIQFVDDVASQPLHSQLFVQGASSHRKMPSSEEATAPAIGMNGRRKLNTIIIDKPTQARTNVSSTVSSTASSGTLAASSPSNSIPSYTSLFASRRLPATNLGATPATTTTTTTTKTTTTATSLTSAAKRPSLSKQSVAIELEDTPTKSLPSHASQRSTNVPKKLTAFNIEHHKLATQLSRHSSTAEEEGDDEEEDEEEDEEGDQIDYHDNSTQLRDNSQPEVGQLIPYPITDVQLADRKQRLSAQEKRRPDQTAASRTSESNKSRHSLDKNQSASYKSGYAKKGRLVMSNSGAKISMLSHESRPPSFNTCQNMNRSTNDVSLDMGRIQPQHHLSQATLMKHVAAMGVCNKCDCANCRKKRKLIAMDDGFPVISAGSTSSGSRSKTKTVHLILKSIILVLLTMLLLMLVLGMIAASHYLPQALDRVVNVSRSFNVTIAG